MEDDAATGTGGTAQPSDAGWGDAPSGGAAGAAGAAGSAGSAGAAAAGGSAGSAIGGSAGATPTNEGDCADGKDGDKDGLVDCADDECTTHVCAPKVPGGWKGPAALALGASPAAACGGDWATEEHDLPQKTFPPAVCAACTCDKTSASCAAPTVISYTSSNCTSTKLTQQLTGSCTSFDAPNPEQVALRLDVASPSGTCTPNAPSPVLPGPIIGDHGRLCSGAPAGGGCSGAACVARPAAPFAELCIFRDGDHACPAEYPTKHALAKSYDDKRGCSACACTGPTCSAAITAFANNDCTGSVLTTLNQDDQCGAFAGNGQNGLGVHLDSAALSCQPTGGQPTGEATPALVTVCCLQP